MSSDTSQLRGNQTVLEKLSVFSVPRSAAVSRSPRIQLAAMAAGAFAFAIFLLRFPPQQFAFYPPCPIHYWLGWQCPGCGITRAAVDFLAGRFGEAARHNPLIFVLVPAAAAFASLQCYSVCRWNRWTPLRIAPVWVMSACTAVLVFAIVRNLP